MTVLAYIRVTAHLPSEDIQRREITEAYHVERWFNDEELSGSTCILELPGFIELCKLARRGDTVIVSSIEHLGSLGPELFKALQALRRKRVGLKSVRGEFDLSSPVGGELFKTLAMLGRLEDRIRGST